MARRHSVVPALAVLALACGQQAAAPSPAVTGTPAPSPPPPRTLIALADDRGPAHTVRLITVDGREVAHADMPPDASPVAASGDVVAFVRGERLEALHPGGAVDVLGQMPGSRGGPVILSPDGRQWLWTAVTASPASLASRLVLSTRGGPDRTVASETATTEPRVLQAFRWTPGGPTYEDAVTGIGGYYMFTFSTGPSWRVDPATGSATPLLAGTCRIADLAADGTTACLQHPDQGTFAAAGALVVTSPGGRRLEVSLPRPRFAQAGAISFRPEPASGPRVLAIGGATGEGANTGRERYETDLVDLGTGAMRRFGPAGLRPGDGSWAWLADGSLICYRPPGALGGDPGVYLVAPGGGARRVFPSGLPIGTVSP